MSKQARDIKLDRLNKLAGFAASASTCARVCLAALLSCGTVACANGREGFRSRPGEAEARVIHYTDDRGLAVTTFAARVEQPVTERVSVFARGLADHIVLTPRPLHPPHQAGNQDTGHFDADVVTSASSTAGGAAGADKWRYEGTLGGQLRFDMGKLPSTFRTYGRVSSEPDYASYSGVARLTTELANGNTTLSTFGGFGHDRVSPFEAPPGQEGQWPATHDRVLLGGSVVQILSPRVLLTVGVAGTRQQGALSNPYRRAIVRTTLFPEIVPSTRYRYTGVLGISWFIGAGTALHLRNGFYRDSWDVMGVAPEVMVAKELGERILLTARYRFVAQTSASFYESVYPSVLPIMTGDPRLGSLREHEGAVSFRWRSFGRAGDYGALSLWAEQGVSRLHYERLPVHPTIVASVTSVGLTLLY